MLTPFLSYSGERRGHGSRSTSLRNPEIPAAYRTQAGRASDVSAAGGGPGQGMARCGTSPGSLLFHLVLFNDCLVFSNILPKTYRKLSKRRLINHDVVLIMKTRVFREIIDGMNR